MDKFSKQIILIGIVLWGLVIGTVLINCIIEEHQINVAAEAVLITPDLSKALNDHK